MIMKYRKNFINYLVLIIFFLSRVSASYSQHDISSKLRYDPVFVRVVSDQIAYPKEAIHAGIYAKIYAGFRIDEKGHIQDIYIINPNKLGIGFEQEIIKKLKRLPSLNPKYEESYALPINFCLKGPDNNSNQCATGVLPSYYYSGRILLDEITVVTNLETVKNQQIILSSKAKGSSFIVNP